MEEHFQPNDDFCTVCGSLLPLPSSAPCTLVCLNCGSSWTLKGKKNVVTYVREKYYEKTVLVDGPKEGNDEGAQVEHLCPKCDFTLATYSTMQTRSADEGQTVFYTCVKCGRKDIEYS